MKLIPQERIQQRTVEKIVDVPILEIHELFVEVVLVIPLEWVPECILEQTLMEAITGFSKPSSLAHVPQLMEENFEVEKFRSQERVKNRTVEQRVDSGVRRIQDEVAVVLKAILQEHVQLVMLGPVPSTQKNAHQKN